MSALADRSWESQGRALDVAVSYEASSEVANMRERLRAVRDTLLVLMIQIVFRAVLLARRWNY
jgi:hypothetical protein